MCACMFCVCVCVWVVLVLQLATNSSRYSLGAQQGAPCSRWLNPFEEISIETNCKYCHVSMPSTHLVGPSLPSSFPPPPRSPLTSPSASPLSLRSSSAPSACLRVGGGCAGSHGCARLRSYVRARVHARVRVCVHASASACVRALVCPCLGAQPKPAAIATAFLPTCDLAHKTTHTPATNHPLPPPGIALVGDPEFAIIDEAYPYIARRLLTDPHPRLREALRYMVYGKSGIFDAGAWRGLVWGGGAGVGGVGGLSVGVCGEVCMGVG